MDCKFEPLVLGQNQTGATGADTPGPVTRAGGSRPRCSGRTPWRPRYRSHPESASATRQRPRTCRTARMRRGSQRPQPRRQRTCWRDVSADRRWQATAGVRLAFWLWSVVRWRTQRSFAVIPNFQHLGSVPLVDLSAWVAYTAVLCGEVRVEPGCTTSCGGALDAGDGAIELGREVRRDG
jgi:hypothetical protein